MQVKGEPDVDLLKKCSRRKIFFTDDYKPKLIANSRGKVRRPHDKNLQAMMQSEDPLFVDFVDKCLEWNLSDRFSPEEAIRHQWIKNGLQEIKAAQGPPTG